MGSSRGRGLVGTLVILAIVAAVMFFGNPSKPKHSTAIQDHMGKKGLVQGLIAVAANKTGAIDAVLVYNNYYVFSTSSLDGKRKTVGILWYVKVIE
jgi:hypothetical protein